MPANMTELKDGSFTPVLRSVCVTILDDDTWAIYLSFNLAMVHASVTVLG